MALAIILALLLVGSVIFNFVSPWQATPVASNWGTIDTTIVITVIITGIFFIGITLFVVYALVKYRHRKPRGDGTHQAAYTPDNKKLEWWLTGITTVGICGLLAPGLVVYNDFVHVPDGADEIEVMAKQWMWSYRLPGEDKKLGHAEVKRIDGSNPYGIDPDDPNGQDDVLINSNIIYLPIDRPVKVLLRSLDVLHNFYVPHFRAKMDMVPGQVSYFWFTPTVLGKYEVLCAEYCGVAHYNMRGHVMVVSQSDYDQWLGQQPTFANSLLSSGGQDGVVEQGKQLAESRGCLACHSIDGSKSLGPGWQGLIGRTETLTDGSTIVVDAEFFKESILAPAEKITQGYSPVMAPYEFSDEQLDALLAYVQSLTAEDNSSAAPTAEDGARVAQNLGCLACHSVDGSKSLGPTWKNMLGRTETLVDGTSIEVDAAYITESITDPNAKIVGGYPPVMQAYNLEPQQLDALLAYARSLSEAATE
ncbi:cytochrome c oxidase subunit II [Oceanicoccus sp. KOV_DT_Chl]|uniref:cytochrome c oxidase subunit II n=1 Tax=Oceanicoccus sp. KOV_DT_Chl TaxID=1904639 RepID=UPI000C7DAA1A|nr:cytochrome c oxidase subunit II [Oceanicoccus sp. KOV_DT_Chl]